MKVLFTSFQQWIHRELSAEQAPVMDESQFLYQRKLIHEEFALSRDQIMSVVFSIQRTKFVECFVQGHQKYLIELLDQLLEQIAPDHRLQIYQTDEKPTLLNLQKCCFRVMEELLLFMETYFTRFYNQDEKVPEQFRMIAIRELAEKLQLLDSRLAGESLLLIATQPLRKLVAEKNEVSHRSLFYMRELLKEIFHFCSPEFPQENPMFPSEQDLNAKLRYLLLYHNFNAHRFFLYYTNLISTEMDQLPTLEKKRECLALHTKNLNQTQSRPGFSYKPQMPPIKTQLLNWIYEETEYIEKQFSQHSSSGGATFPDKFKISTSLSVSQLGLFLRVAVDLGLINNKNLTVLFQFISCFVKTQRRENISAGSLKGNFYESEDSTREALKEILEKMARTAQKSGGVALQK
jgi:hypothetical protein